jgi:hypothetical protein
LQGTRGNVRDVAISFFVMNRKSAAQAVRVYRGQRWVKVVTGLAPFLFLAATFSLCQSEGWSWLTVGGACVSLLSILGFADALSTRVELTGDALIVVKNLRRAEYPRADFTSVICAKGVAVSMRRASGEVVELPDVGGSNRGLAKVLRHWLEDVAGA